MKRPSAQQINPDLPQESQDQGIQFRLNKISEIRDFLENEVYKGTNSEENTRLYGTFSTTQLKFRDSLQSEQEREPWEPLPPESQLL